MRERRSRDPAALAWYSRVRVGNYGKVTGSPGACFYGSLFFSFTFLAGAECFFVSFLTRS